MRRNMLGALECCISESAVPKIVQAGDGQAKYRVTAKEHPFVPLLGVEFNPALGLGKAAQHLKH